MFTVYRSNQLELLQQLVATVMQHDPLPSPFDQEIVLVPNIGMAQWLQLQLAQTMGIAAHIECLLPATFIWRLLTQLIPKTTNTEQTFGKTALSWKLMTLLQNLPTEECYSPISNYLQDDEQHHKNYQLAQQLSDLFDRYLVYRPDWLTAWEHGEKIPHLSATQSWQALLWNALLRYTASLGQSLDHRAILYQRLLSTIDNGTADFPQRLFIFGLSTLPPIFLALLQALSRHCAVHMMLLEPCRFYWFDPHPTAAIPGTVTDHPLLISWGQTGREFRSLLLQYDICDIDAMVDHSPASLLQGLQHELLESVNHASSTQPMMPWQYLNPTDQSLRFNACYSPHREVELLQDTLLKYLDDNLDLSPRDILVMTPNLPCYLPYIQAIFGQAPRERYLPFHIVGQDIPVDQGILHAFLLLLSLPNSRFETEMMLSLLEIPSIAERFTIEATALQRLRLWIKEVGIHWGLNSRDLEKWGITSNSRHTWDSGLQRLLFGYAMSRRTGPFREQLPYDIIGDEAAELVGKLANFIDAITEWQQRLAQPKTLTEWLPCGQKILEDFFASHPTNQPTLELIQQQWQQWIQAGIATNYAAEVDISLLYQALANQLQQLPSNDRFLAGSINFCALMPMRAIPHSLICLLGMDDGKFPHPAVQWPSDLINQAPRLGDSRRNQEDRYLFLEILLSARSRLHISYIGRSIQDNQPRQPAIVVSELIDHCCQHYRLAGNQDLPPEMAANQLRQHLIQQQPLMPFSESCFLPSNPWQSYAVEWLAAAQQRPILLSPFCPKPLPIIINRTQFIDFSTIKQFYQHPVRSFFQQRWQINFATPSEPLSAEEPFSLPPNHRYRFNETLLDTLIQQRSPTQHYQHQVTAGTLPYGHCGQLVWRQQYQRLQPLANQLQQLLPTELKEIKLNLAEISLQATLAIIPEQGILRWQAVELQIQHAIMLWLEHLLLCAAGYVVCSHYYGLKNSYWGFSPVPREKAEMLLNEWLIGWQQGQQQPLLLLPKCGWAWLQTLYQPASNQLLLNTPKDLQKAQQKLQQAWYGTRQFTGSCADPYYQRLWRSLNVDAITAITDNAQRFLLPLAQYRQTKT